MLEIYANAPRSLTPRVIVDAISHGSNNTRSVTADAPSREGVAETDPARKKKPNAMAPQLAEGRQQRRVRRVDIGGSERRRSPGDPIWGGEPHLQRFDQTAAVPRGVGRPPPTPPRKGRRDQAAAFLSSGIREALDE